MGGSKARIACGPVCFVVRVTALHILLYGFTYYFTALSTYYFTASLKKLVYIKYRIVFIYIVSPAARARVYHPRPCRRAVAQFRKHIPAPETRSSASFAPHRRAALGGPHVQLVHAAPFFAARAKLCALAQPPPACRALGGCGHRRCRQAVSP